MEKLQYITGRNVESFASVDHSVLKSDLSTLFYEALKDVANKESSCEFSLFRGIPYRNIDSQLNKAEISHFDLSY